MSTPVGEWSNLTELQDEIGAKNIFKLANIDSDNSQTTIDRMTQRAMTAADSVVNGVFRKGGYQIPLTALPGKTIDSPLIRLCATKIAHWQLYTTKGKRDQDVEGNHVQEKYDWAISMLESMIEAGIDAVPEGGDDSGEDQPVQPGQMRSFKINKRDIFIPDEWSRQY